MNKKKMIALLCASVLTTNVYPNIPVLAAETIQSETQQETQEDGESAQEEPQEPGDRIPKGQMGEPVPVRKR